jgi:3-isopropylmalate dehydrogenase
MSASSINLAVIPGDGIGPEVIAEAVKVLEKAVAAEGVALEQTHYKLGAQHWLETGETLPD